MNIAEQLVEVLVQAGVQRVYGVVGDSLNPIVDAIRRTQTASNGCTCTTRRPARSRRRPRPS